MAPGNHWFWGHLRLVAGIPFQDSLQRLTQTADNDHGRCSYFIGSQAYISVLRWQDAQAILHVEFTRSYPQLIERYITNVFGKYSIGLLRERVWKYERSAILRSLAPHDFLRASRQSIRHVTQTMVQTLKQRIALSSSSSSSITATTDESPPPFLELPVEHLIKMITVDILGLTIFDDDRLFDCCRQLQLSSLAQAFENLGTDLNRRLSAPLDPRNLWPRTFGGTPDNRRFLQDRALLQSFLQRMIQQRQQEPQERRQSDNNGNNNNSKSKDFLTLLMEAHDDEINSKSSSSSSSSSWKAELPLDQIIKDVTLSILFAGFDTTTITLTYTLYLISRHPPVEANCLEEIRRVVQDQHQADDNHEDNDDDITQRLVYLRGVIREALRLYPPAYTTSRNLQKDQTLPPVTGNYNKTKETIITLPKGCTVLVPIWSLQRHECNFPDPLSFRPDRWVKKRGGDNPQHQQSCWVERYAEDEEPITSSSSSSSSSSHNDYIPPGNRKALLAFSAGARSCPGSKFAMTEAVLILAGLLSEFRFERIVGNDDDDDATDDDIDAGCRPERNGIVQRPANGLPMRISVRNQ